MPGHLFTQDFLTPAAAFFLASQKSRHNRPGRSNHIQHSHQQQTHDPDLEVGNVSLRGVVRQRPIQFVPQVRSGQRRLLDRSGRHRGSPLVALIAPAEGLVCRP